MSRLSYCLLSLIICCAFCIARAQTATVIPANEAAAHVGEYATVEGLVAKLFTTKSGNTFLNIGGSYPNQTFTGWIQPASAVSKSPILADIEGNFNARSSFDNALSASVFSLLPNIWLDSLKYSQV